MVEVEEGMGEVEDTDRSHRTLTSPLRVTNTTVASLTHLVEGATRATVRTRERERERELGLWGGSCCVPSAFSAEMSSVLLSLPAPFLPRTARE